MTRFASFFVGSLLVVACQKTAATDPPASVPVGSLPRGEATSEAPAPEAAPPKPASTCGLRATVREIKTQDKAWHKFSIDLKNEGPKSVKLIMPGDGSTDGWRTPTLTWSATTADGKEAGREPVGRCGMMNPLRVEEVFTLNPGETKTLDEWVDPTPWNDGTFDVKVRYVNDPSLALRGKPGEASGDVAKAFASTDTCEVTSNAIKVTYVNAKNP